MEPTFPASAKAWKPIAGEMEFLKVDKVACVFPIGSKSAVTFETVVTYSQESAGDGRQEVKS